MKFYVASRFRNYRFVRSVCDDLRTMGHEITYDWTRTGEFDDDGELRIDPQEDLSEWEKYGYALQDRRGAMQCDALILLLADDLCGAYIEVGMALAAGRPVFVVGDVKRWTIFYALPEVQFFDTWEELRTLLEAWVDA